MHTQRWQFQPKLNKQLSNWISSPGFEKKQTFETNSPISGWTTQKFHQTPKKIQIYPVGSMYGIFPYIYGKNQPNVGEYTSPMDPMGTRQKNLMMVTALVTVTWLTCLAQISRIPTWITFTNPRTLRSLLNNGKQGLHSQQYMMFHPIVGKNERVHLNDLSDTLQ